MRRMEILRRDNFEKLGTINIFTLIPEEEGEREGVFFGEFRSF